MEWSVSLVLAIIAAILAVVYLLREDNRILAVAVLLVAIAVAVLGRGS